MCWAGDIPKCVHEARGGINVRRINLIVFFFYLAFAASHALAAERKPLVFIYQESEKQRGYTEDAVICFSEGFVSINGGARQNAE